MTNKTVVSVYQPDDNRFEQQELLSHDVGIRPTIVHKQFYQKVLSPS